MLNKNHKFYDATVWLQIKVRFETHFSMYSIISKKVSWTPANI